jgi:hypothetical protein
VSLDMASSLSCFDSSSRTFSATSGDTLRRHDGEAADVFLWPLPWPGSRFFLFFLKTDPAARGVFFGYTTAALQHGVVSSSGRPASEAVLFFVVDDDDDIVSKVQQVDDDESMRVKQEQRGKGRSRGSWESEETANRESKRRNHDESRKPPLL